VCKSILYFDSSKKTVNYFRVCQKKWRFEFSYLNDFFTTCRLL